MKSAAPRLYDGIFEGLAECGLFRRNRFWPFALHQLYSFLSLFLYTENSLRIQLSGAVAGGGAGGPCPPEKNLSDNFVTCRKFLSLYL